MRRLSSLLLAAALVFVLTPSALAAAPANDEQSGATVITVTQDAPYSVSMDTTEATTNASDPQMPGPYQGDPSIPLYGTVWFSYTAAETGTITVDATTSTYSAAVIQLSSSLVFLNVAEPANSFDVTGGQTYYFMVGHRSGSGGTLELSVTLPPPVVIDLVVSAAITRASLDGVNLFVSGTWTQVAGNAVTGAIIWVDAQQPARGKRLAVSGGWEGVFNAGGTWSASIPADTGTWAATRTTFDADFTFTDGTALGFDYPSAVLNIRRK